MVIGELHGTAEIPAVFSEFVCVAASVGSRVLVGLEFPESARDDFQSYISSAGLADDRAKFLNDSGWTQNARRSADGRTSEAVFSVLDRLQQLRDSGLEVSVTTFVRGSEQDNAASLLEAQSDYDLVIVLVGDMHARTVPSDVEGLPSIEPMAKYLPTEYTLTLGALGLSGEAWNCQRNCGVHQLFEFPFADNRRGVILDSALHPLSPGYDGVIVLDRVTSSPPLF